MNNKEEKLKVLGEKLQTLKERVDKLDLKAEVRASLEEKLNAAQGALQDGNVAEVTGIVKEIVSAIKGTRRKPLKKKLSAAKEEVGKKEVIDALKSAKDLIEAGGVPRESIEKAREAFARGQVSFREGNYREALKSLKEAEMIILRAKEVEEKAREETKKEAGEEMVEVKEEAAQEVEGKEAEERAEEVERKEAKVGGEEEEKYTKTLEEFFSRLEKLKSLGGEVSPIDEHIRFIEGAKASGDLKGAAETASGLLGWLDEYISSLGGAEGEEPGIAGEAEGALRGEIDEFMLKVERIKELGGDISPIGDHLAYIDGALSSGDVKGAHSVVKSLSEWIDTYLKTLKAPGKEEGEEEVKERAPEEGVKEEAAEERVEVKEEAAQEVERKEVEKEVGEERREVEEEERRREGIIQKLADFEKIIERLGEDGLNVTPLKKIYGLTRGKIEEGDLTGAEQLLGRLDAAHKNLLKKEYSKRLEELKKEVEESSSFFESRGVDVDSSGLTHIVESISEKLERGDLSDVEKLISEGERTLKSFEVDGYNMLYQKRMIPIINGIKHLKESGVDVSSLQQYLETVKELYTQGDYSQWERDSLQLKKNVDAYEANQLLSRLREGVVKLQEVGAPQADYTELYNDALKLYKEGEFEKVIEMCKNTIEEVNSLYKQQSIKMLKGKLNQLILSGDSVGLSTGVYRDAIERADEMVDKGNWDGAKELLEENVELLKGEIAKAESLKKRAEEISGELNDIRNQLLSMAREGAATSQISKKVQRAKDLLQEKAVNEAAELLEEIKEDIEKLKRGPEEEKREEEREEIETLRAKELSIIITQIKERITKMKALGMDTGKYQSDLLIMLQTFKRGEMDRAIEQGKACLSRIKEELGE